MFVVFAKHLDKGLIQLSGAKLRILTNCEVKHYEYLYSKSYLKPATTAMFHANLQELSETERFQKVN